MAEWKTYIPDEQYGVEIGDRRKGFISATVVRKPDGNNIAYLDMIRSIKTRQEGIGTNLLRGLADEVKKQGVTTLSGNLTNEAVLRTFARVFGADNLEFHDLQNKKLDITFEEAVRRNVSYIVTADLQKYGEQK